MKRHLWLGVLVVFLISGCAGTVTRKETPDAVAITGALKVKSVEVSMSSKAKEQLPDNIKFDSKAFGGTVERTLSASELLDAIAENRLSIEVTNVYIRGTFTAVMFGFMAGVDNITGDVRVVDAAGKALRSFQISADYGWGGLAGGQDSVRINYLYEKFGELTRDQLRGQN